MLRIRLLCTIDFSMGRNMCFLIVLNMKPMLGCVSNYLNESKLDGISEKVIHVSGIQQLCVNEIEFLVVFNPSGLLFTLFGRIICL